MFHICEGFYWKAASAAHKWNVLFDALFFPYTRYIGINEKKLNYP